MNNRERSAGYEIRVKGVLDENWSGWFEGLQVSPAPGGETSIAGLIVDQAALHGLLAKVRDLGLPLIAVKQLPPDWRAEA